MILHVLTVVLVNHSCEPNVAFDLTSPDRSKWHLKALHHIKEGEMSKCRNSVPDLHLTNSNAPQSPFSIQVRNGQWTNHSIVIVGRRWAIHFVISSRSGGLFLSRHALARSKVHNICQGRSFSHVVSSVLGSWNWLPNEIHCRQRR